MVTTSETHDGKGAADHDRPYQFGHPGEGMNLWAKMHLILLRGQVMAYRQGDPGGPADGDLDWVRETPSGIWEPIPCPPKRYMGEDG